MLMFKDHAAAGTRLIWVVSTATQGHGDISVRLQSGFMVQLHPGSVMVFVVHVTTDGHGRYGLHGLGAWELILPLKGHFSGRTGPPSYWENWLQRFGVGKLWWPSENYIHTSQPLQMCVGELVLVFAMQAGKLALTLRPGAGGDNRGPGLTISATTRAHIQDFKLANPTSTPIMSCWRAAGSQWMGAARVRISEESLDEGPVLMMYQMLEPDQQLNAMNSCR